MPMTLSGDGTITGLAVGGLPNATVTAADLASGAARSNFGAGAVLQVAQGYKTDTFSTTSTSLQDVSGLTVTLTPASSSSKFLIMVNMTYLNTFYVGRIALLRNGTEIGKADAAGSRPLDFLYYSNSTNSAADGQWVRESMDYLDSPATTSAITYAVQVASYTNSAGVTFINRGADDNDNINHTRSASSIIVMEIAG